MRAKWIVQAAAVFSIAVCSAASAATISFSFGPTLAPTETAGAPGVSAANYNAITGSTTIAPKDDSGTTLSGTSAVFTSHDFGFNGGSNSVTNDAHLFSGWSDQADG